MWELNRTERKALVAAVVLLVSGAVVREAGAPGAAAWSWRPAGDGGRDGASVAAVRAAVRKGVADETEASRPLARGERLDPNAAAEPALRRLPGVGPTRARAIVEAREERPFRSARDLLRVRGIGEATLARIVPHLALPSDGPGTAPGGGTARGPAAAACGDPAAVDVNAAGPTELERLPWIGPARARQIVEIRDRTGGFRSADDLIRVPGIGPYTLDRLRKHVCVR